MYRQGMGGGEKRERVDIVASEIFISAGCKLFSPLEDFAEWPFIAPPPFRLLDLRTVDGRNRVYQDPVGPQVLSLWGQMKRSRGEGPRALFFLSKFRDTKNTI